jgi:hypothetical protein
MGTMIKIVQRTPTLIIFLRRLRSTCSVGETGIAID